MRIENRVRKSRDVSQPSDGLTGELVETDERFFLVRTKGNLQVSDERLIDLEREFIGGSRWWSRADLISTDEIVFPEDLAEILVDAGVS